MTHERRDDHTKEHRECRLLQFQNNRFHTFADRGRRVLPQPGTADFGRKLPSWQVSDIPSAPHARRKENCRISTACRQHHAGLVPNMRRSFQNRQTARRLTMLFDWVRAETGRWLSRPFQRINSFSWQGESLAFLRPPDRSELELVLKDQGAAVEVFTTEYSILSQNPPTPRQRGRGIEADEGGRLQSCANRMVNVRRAGAAWRRSF